MIRMGIDSSKHKTGLAILKDEKIIYEKLVTFPKDMSVGEHLNLIRNNVKWFISRFKPEEVIVEDLNIVHMSAARHMFLYHGVIKEVVWFTTKQDATYVVNSEWRKPLGIKNPSKDEKIQKAYQIGTKRNGSPKLQEWDVKCVTIEYINKRLGTKYEYDDNDLADAVGLCLWGHDGGKVNAKDGRRKPKTKKKL